MTLKLGKIVVSGLLGDCESSVRCCTEAFAFPESTLGGTPRPDGDTAGLAGTALEVDCGHAQGKATSHTVEAAASPMFLAQCSF